MDPHLVCNNFCLMSVNTKIFLGTECPKFNYKTRKFLGTMNEPDIYARKTKALPGWRTCFQALLRVFMPDT